MTTVHPPPTRAQDDSLSENDRLIEVRALVRSLLRGLADWEIEAKRREVMPGTQRSNAPTQAPLFTALARHYPRVAERLLLWAGRAERLSGDRRTPWEADLRILDVIDRGLDEVEKESLGGRS